MACSKDTICVEVTVKSVGCCFADNVSTAIYKLNTSICSHTAVHVRCLWHIFTCCCSAQAHWTATVHFAFLAVTGAFVLSLLPFLYFGFHTYWHWYHTDSKGSLQPSAATGADEPSQETSEAQSGDLHPTCISPISHRVCKLRTHPTDRHAIAVVISGLFSLQHHQRSTLQHL